MSNETFIQSVFLNLAANTHGQRYNVDISNVPKGVTKCIVRQVIYSTDYTELNSEEKMFFIRCSLAPTDYIACAVVYEGSPTFNSSPGTIVKLQKPLDSDKMELEIVNGFNQNNKPQGFLGLILEFHK